MNEYLKLLIEVFLVPAIPIVLGYFCKFVNKAVAEKTSNMNSAKEKEYINNACEAVTSAVVSVTQTYVDTLKKAGTFDAAAQATALSTAKSLAISLITEDAQKAITQVYGDFNTWLSTKIEQEVKVTKATPVVTSVVLNAVTN